MAPEALSLFSDRSNSRKVAPELSTYLKDTRPTTAGSVEDRQSKPFLVTGPASVGLNSVPEESNRSYSSISEQVEDGETEKHANGIRSASTIRFVNTPFATPLSTIVEQDSWATLDSKPQKSIVQDFAPQESQQLRKQISKSLDEAALLELRNLVANVRVESSNLSSDPVSDVLGTSSVQVAQPVYGAAFARSSTPPGRKAWPGDREGGAPTTIQGTSNRARRSTAQQGFLRAVRDYFRVTTPSQHGQTAFSSENIQAVRSSRRRNWRPARNTFNYRGQHPFERDYVPALKESPMTFAPSTPRLERSNRGQESPHVRFEDFPLPLRRNTTSALIQENKTLIEQFQGVGATEAAEECEKDWRCFMSHLLCGCPTRHKNAPVQSAEEYENWNNV